MILKIRILWLFIIVLLLVACSSGHLSEKLVIKHSVSEFSDTLFFSDVWNMSVYEQKIYLVEHNHERIFCLNDDLTLDHIIGTQGEGPQELNYVSGFSIFGDTLFLIDIGNSRFASYNLNGAFLVSYPLSDKIPVMNEFRFVFDGLQSVQISSTDNQGAFADIDFLSDTISFWGERYAFKYSDAERLRNGRFLFANKEYYVAISDNKPIIEIYSRKDKEKIQSYDYSEIDEVDGRISYLKSLPVQGSNSYSLLCGDACVYNDKVYLLLMSNEGQLFFERTIAVFDLYPELKLKQTLDLPGEVYSSFCVSDGTIFAFNREKAIIESFEYKTD